SRMDDLQSYLDKALKEVQLVKADDKPNFTDYDIEAELCDLITNTRNQLGITQKQLAEKSGVSQANISKIENGSYKPSIPVLKRIADGLGKRLVIEFADREEVL
ncbi:MAG: helix-turn-helix transcriptional regulator, partial [Thermotaleaceae bacterium]